MGKFKSYSEGVEVVGQTILCFIYGVPKYEDEMRELLVRHGLEDIQPDGWYPQQKWLDAFSELFDNYGPFTLFTLGKSIPEQAAFRLQFTELEQALRAVDVVYQMNRRNGEVGHYTITKYDAELKEALMECTSPYPADFERGVLVGMIRKYKSHVGSVPKVELLSPLTEGFRTFSINW
ncbi:hypothetical protein [Arcticibacter eurypsychrophilus]|uniref:hypothetical protein n=1 Tax=Arcticibacter eurypsychrophilus TaxID=1434752 RepID=UPI00084DA64A|nr:hypothetical protein [Arcticibacter eurypsychrophilus]